MEASETEQQNKKITKRCDDVVGYARISQGLHREHDHIGLRGCMSRTSRVLTCDMCACGRADACCGKADPFVSVSIVYERRHNRQVNAMTGFKMKNPPLQRNIRETLLRTQTVNNNHDPVWNLTKLCPLLIEAEEFRKDKKNNVKYPLLRLTVFDDDFVGMENNADIIGCVEVPLEDLLQHPTKLQKFKSKIKSGKDKRNAGTLSWEFKFEPNLGSAKSYEALGYYKAQHGNDVTLYQDACVDPKAVCFRDCVKPPDSCWTDIYNSIDSASKAIFICGWSVNPETTLIRTTDGKNVSISEKSSRTRSSITKSITENNSTKGEITSSISRRTLLADPETFGELLKRKAKKNVKVFILLWEDQANQMGTTWKETIAYFANEPNVHVNAVPRSNVLTCTDMNKGQTDALSHALQQLSFTHHQKLVICDVGDKLHAYVGGLDITGGRYDDQNHNLFRTLKKEHKDDFYNGCLPGAVDPKEGPREPWHDVHARVIGPAARTILETFVQRCLKQANYYASLCKAVSHVNRSLSSSSLESENYSIQVLRSIDSSVTGFDSNKYTDNFKGGDVIIENSIHMSYVKNILNAKKFIYIENQYFMGTSSRWPNKNFASWGVDNLIPRAIVQRCRKAIRQNEEFTAYIVMPLFPEGDPASFTSQEIILWETQTLEYMYKAITKELRNCGKLKENDAKDYLQIFFLAKREKDSEVIKKKSSMIALKNATTHAQIYRRFMIYVHSKLLIVDDKFAIIGSANINERSLEGTRDSEIAIGVWSSDKQNKIKTLRENLWREHFGSFKDYFHHPEKKENARKIHNIAKLNRSVFIDDSQNKMLPYGQICAFMFNVNKTQGTLTAIQDNHVDYATASITGKWSGYQIFQQMLS